MRDRGLCIAGGHRQRIVDLVARFVEVGADGLGSQGGGFVELLPLDLGAVGETAPIGGNEEFASPHGKIGADRLVRQGRFDFREGKDISAAGPLGNAVADLRRSVGIAEVAVAPEIVGRGPIFGLDNGDKGDPAGLAARFLRSVID